MLHFYGWGIWKQILWSLVETELLNLEDLKADILFAHHHGRASGKIPEKILRKIKPKIIVIGEAPSEDLNYYYGYDTITQNAAKDIWFDCDGNIVDIYATGNVNCNTLRIDFYKSKTNYKGTLTLGQQWLQIQDFGLIN